MNNPTLQDIILEVLPEWLLEHGYDGLCNGDYECSCYREHELFTCSFDLPRWPECQAGYKRIGPDGDSIISLIKEDAP